MWSYGCQNKSRCLPVFHWELPWEAAGEVVTDFVSFTQTPKHHTNLLEVNGEPLVLSKNHIHKEMGCKPFAVPSPIYYT